MIYGLTTPRREWRRLSRLSDFTPPSPGRRLLPWREDGVVGQLRPAQLKVAIPMLPPSFTEHQRTVNCLEGFMTIRPHRLTKEVA